MKRVEALSVEEMEAYLARMERLKKTVGGFYRIFWPFRTWSPFSPTKLVLNLVTLISWTILVFWLAFRPYSEQSLLIIFGQLWAVTLLFCLVLGLAERHYRIKIRYRAMTARHQAPNYHPPPKGEDPPYYYGREFYSRVFR